MAQLEGAQTLYLGKRLAGRSVEDRDEFGGNLQVFLCAANDQRLGPDIHRDAVRPQASSSEPPEAAQAAEAQGTAGNRWHVRAGRSAFSTTANSKTAPKAAK